MVLPGTLGQTNSRSPAIPNPLFANHVNVMTVENGDGKTLGTIRAVVLDAISAQPRYIVVSSGGFLGIRSKLRVVPAQRLSAATAKKNVVALNITESRWNQAPVSRSSVLSSLQKAVVRRQIAEFYGVDKGSRTANASGNGPRSVSSTPRKATLSATSRTSRKPAATAKPPERGNFVFAHDLVGRTLANADRQKLGEIEDVMFTLDGEAPAMVIVSAGRLLKARQTYAVALNSLRIGSEKKIDWPVEAAFVQQAPTFDRQAWAEKRSKVYRYSPVE